MRSLTACCDRYEQPFTSRCTPKAEGALLHSEAQGYGASMRGGLPAGTVTFLFTDVADSRRRWAEAPIDMAEVLRAHDDVVRTAIERHGGSLFGTGSDGMRAVFSMFTAGSACTGTYRALELWEAAVIEAGSLDRDDVIAALDHARIATGPGGPAEMVPGQHHVRMNMYIARSEGGTFKVLENLGHIDPKECDVARA